MSLYLPNSTSSFLSFTTVLLQSINSIIYINTIIQNKMLDSTKITIITLTQFFIGFIVLDIKNLLLYFPLYFFITLFLIILFVQYLLRVQRYWQAHKCGFTMYTFGLICNYCLKYPQPFTIYLIVLTIYFYGEFQLVNCYHHQNLSWQSFLIYHSKQYTIANCAMLFQHVITRYYFNFGYKHHHFLTQFAGFIMVIGLILRITAFFTAKSNFTHLVRSSKVEGHQLVTNGIYKYLRHPSYTGYFYFSVASMIFIGNFVCSFLFAIVLFKFFKERIEYEEYTLLKFFKNYDHYRSKTYILIPFISGYEPQYRQD